MKRIHKPYIGLESYFKNQGINLMEVSIALNISLASLYNKMHGRSDFTLMEALTLKDKFGVDADLFCD